MKQIGNTIIFHDSEASSKGKRSQAYFNKAHNVISIKTDPKTGEETVHLLKLKSQEKFIESNFFLAGLAGTKPHEKWLMDDPDQEEIDQNPDGSEFIPIFHVEKKLTRLDPHWGTENFRFQFLAHPSGYFADGSLEVVVTYGGKVRRLVGAATIVVSDSLNVDDVSSNLNFGATLKSECIKNAVKAIGAAFGATLNDRDIIATSPVDRRRNGLGKPPAIALKPDVAMQGKYNDAFERNDVKIGDAIRAVYPDIQYTGNKQQ